MLIVKVGKKENINQAVKRMKKKVRDTGLIKQIRERQQFLKPSVKKRKAKQKAIRKEQWQRLNENV